MLLALDVACVEESTEAMRRVLKRLFTYAEGAYHRGELEHVEQLLPKLEAVSDVLNKAEAEAAAAAVKVEAADGGILCTCA